MNSIAKAAVSSKFSSVGKSLGWDADKDEVQDEGISAKELRKSNEQHAAARAKREKQHAKRNAEREKKREEIRAKYGLKEDHGKSKRSGSTTRETGNDLNTTNAGDQGEGKQCHVMWNVYLPEKDKRYLGDVKLTYRRMITLALKLCKASSGEENLEHVHRPVIMHHCVSYLGSASIVLLAFEQALCLGKGWKNRTLSPSRLPVHRLIVVN